MPTEILREGSPLTAWLAARGLIPLGIEPLAGDLSPRRYHRLLLPAGASAILAVYPPDHQEACRRFLRTSELLTQAGVRVPAVLAGGCDHGWTVVEDLGTRTLFDAGPLGWEALVDWYDGAAQALTAIGGLAVTDVAPLSPPLDAGLLRRELDQTIETFLEPRGFATPRDRGVGPAFDELCAALARGAQVPCHRDFMARNLVPLPGGSVGVLDHQDLRMGPRGYDLASLLNDSLFAPRWLEERLLAGSPALAGDRQAYHRAAAQRTLKAIGTFASFARRGSPRHVPLIAPTFARALDHLAAVPETRDLAASWRDRNPEGGNDPFCYTETVGHPAGLDEAGS